MANLWEEMFALASGSDPVPEKALPVPPALSAKEARKASSAFDRWANDAPHTKTLTPGLIEARLALNRLWQDPSSTELVKIGGLLPADVAEGALVSLQAVSEAAWMLASKKTDSGRTKDGAGSTNHTYAVGDGGPQARSVDTLRSVLQSLLPGTHCAFQAGRYTRGHFIEPHDDTASKSVAVEGGSMEVTYDRDIACIYYLSKSWDERLGGLFVDLQERNEHVPLFNSLVAFRVPRMHEVTPLNTDRPRFSIFGWFYRPEADKTTSEARAGNDSTLVPAKKKKKKKRKAGGSTAEKSGKKRKIPAAPNQGSV
jgi:hypothetical protein